MTAPSRVSSARGEEDRFDRRPGGEGGEEGAEDLDEAEGDREVGVLTATAVAGRLQ